MTFEQINNPTIIAEVTDVFYRYEQALKNNNIKVLDELFWHDKRTVRLGLTENLYGIQQIRTFRKRRSLKELERTLHNTIINTFGDNYAVCSTEFTRKGIGKIGRQQQTWVRMLCGWRIVAAQISFMK
ncbi:oxalurate catabolism protein HpxZ [Pantoea sp. Aalb]|nr:oxalurate catabolism protein HpxZ [Pantoea sp. Aalb]MXP67604.1 oxalurate catabolism protein HpxZ [Pantoea sp. Aalb]